MMPDVTPKTESGRALMYAIGPDWEPTNAEVRDTIAAIEQEAASKAVAEADGMRLALADLTAAYHQERKHEGRWAKCQHPRCQNARLATDNRGPFADQARALAARLAARLADSGTTDGE